MINDRNINPNLRIIDLSFFEKDTSVIPCLLQEYESQKNPGGKQG